MALQAPFAPVEVDKIRMAFPASVMKDLMPAEADIPEEFWGQAPGEWTTPPPGWEGRVVDGQAWLTTGWIAIANSWFNSGLPADVEFASVAFLLSQWCTTVEKWRK